MTGPEHYREAERLLEAASRDDLRAAAVRVHDEAGKVDFEGVGLRDRARRFVARAHVHAQLALAAAAYDGLAEGGGHVAFGGEPAVRAFADELDETTKAART